MHFFVKTLTGKTITLEISISVRVSCTLVCVARTSDARLEESEACASLYSHRHNQPCSSSGFTDLDADVYGYVADSVGLKLYHQTGYIALAIW